MSLFLWSRTPTSLGVITSSSFAADFVFLERVFAAQWLWERTGETKEVLPTHPLKLGVHKTPPGTTLENPLFSDLSF